MKMQRYLLGAGLLVAIGLGGACAHESKYDSARKSGQEVGEAVATKAHFADQLAMLDRKEIELGKLALQKSSNIELRAFAQQLIENHEQHLDSLEKYAEASALRLVVVDLYTDEDAEGGTGGAGMEGAKESVEKSSQKYDEKTKKQIAEFKDEVQKLSAKSGPEFDRAILEQIREDQEEGQKLAEKGLKKYSDDASLAMLLGRSAPIFESHEERAKELKESIY